MAQKYNPLLQYGFQETTSGGGGGGVSAADPYGIPGTFTNFQSINDTPITTANAFSNNEFYYPFLINGNVTISAFAKYINNVTSGTGKVYGSIYKLNTDTSNLELIAVQPTEFDYNSTTGTTGWQVVNLTAPVDLTAGVYFMRGICSSSGSAAFRYYNIKSTLAGQQTTALNTYYGYSRYSIPYDFGSTPSTISFSALTLDTSIFVAALSFYCQIK